MSMSYKMLVAAKDIGRVEKFIQKFWPRLILGNVPHLGLQGDEDDRRSNSRQAQY